MYLDIFNHKDIPLYVVDIPYGLNRVHTEYFTRIPWGEYKRIRYAERFNSLSNFELKVKIFREYTLRTPKWTDLEIDYLPAGIVDTVANLIMYISDSGIIPDSNGNINIEGFTQRLNMYRTLSVTNVEYQMYTIICVVFKAYTFEALDKLPFDRIASLFASAEKYLLENGVLKSPLEIYDPRNSAKQTPPKTTKSNKKSEPKSEVDNLFIEEFIKFREEAERKKEKQQEMDNLKDKNLNAPTPAPKPVAPQTAPKEDITYIQPKDKVAVSNGIQMNVPGIKIDKNNKIGGFDADDFVNLPMYSDEEALAHQLEMGLAPAGYEIILEREKRALAAKQVEEANTFKKIGVKVRENKKFKRK
jgi:hypothetical protein